ncbi:MAG: RluA family pseudouridine synthase [Burkholderiales bacterium]
MPEVSKASVRWVEVDEQGVAQRIDNYLLKILKGVPKSHIYRILRSGEVRVNSGRVDATYRLELGDKLRLPPVRVAEPAVKSVFRLPADKARLMERVIYQDDALIILDKPAGMAVHGGSGVSLGIIEQLRLELPQQKFLELAHRLDRETSGILLLAKKRAALVALHELMRPGSDASPNAGRMEKRYLALVAGDWKNRVQHVKFSLLKQVTADGERRVHVDPGGMAAHTVFHLRQRYPNFSLLEAELKTGRTHQIRVHLAHLGFPIAGDDKYGDFELNRQVSRRGLKRMFLHAWRVVLPHPLTGETLKLEAPPPPELEKFLQQL